ncbi:MAG TPA: hypothetical protein VGI92_05990 [Gemmatimonadales bacterium]|jgi:hypothetical protein
MTSRLSAILMMLLLLAALAPSLAAQAPRFHLGPHLSYNFDAKVIGIGPQLSIPVASHLEFYPSFEYFFVNSGSLWGLNADLKYRLPAGKWSWVYLGGGPNLTRSSIANISHTDSHLGLLAGFESRHGRVHPYAEFRALVGHGSTSQVAVGLNFTLRHR